MDSTAHPPLESTSESPSIRLIELVLDDDPEIQCKFHVRSLSDKYSYVALSYTWGDFSTRKQIYVNGHEFPVGPNLHAALHAIRKRLRETKNHGKKKQNPLDALQKLSFGKSSKQPFCKYGKLGTPYFPEQVEHELPVTLFWIDQLCINQIDIEERNAQVQLMSRIYTSARIVLVWLGTHKDPDAVHGTIACLEATNLAIAKKKKFKHFTRPSDSQRKVMHDMADNPYWTRVWIVQELMLAQTALVQLANTVFEYQELLPMFTKGPGNVQQNYTFGSDGFKRWNIDDTPMGRLLWLRSTLHDLKKDEAKVTVHMLLTLLEKQMCSDRRDKVYGLLGLRQLNGPQSESDHVLWADYSLSPAGVYGLVLRDASSTKFSDAARALDLCRKAGLALNLDWKDDQFVIPTAELLIRVVGDNRYAWNHDGKEIDIAEIHNRLRKCNWRYSVDDVVAIMVPGISRAMERAKRGY